MKVKSHRQFSIPGEIGNFIVDAAGNCIVLTRYGRKIFHLDKEGTIKAIELPVNPNFIGQIHWTNDLHKGAIFHFNQGFGVIFEDIIYIWDDWNKTSSKSYIISNSLDKDEHGRTLQPSLANQINNENKLLILLGCYWDKRKPGRFFCEIELNHDEAVGSTNHGNFIIINLRIITYIHLFLTVMTTISLMHSCFLMIVFSSIL